MYEWACCKAYDICKARGKEMNWKDGHEMYEWWLTGKAPEKEPNFTDIFFFGQEGEDEE